MMAVTWGTPTPVTTRVVQMLPGPMPTFTASTPRRTSSRAPASVATLPAMSWTSGNASRSCARPSRARPRCGRGPSRRPARRRRRRPAPARAVDGSGAAADRRGHAKPAVLVLVGVGMLAALEDVLDRDEPLEHALGVHHRQLLDPMPGQDPLGLVQPGADRRGDQLLLGHRLADRLVEVALELEIAVGDDADQPALRRPRSARPRS